jgi:hypothetical protein
MRKKKITINIGAEEHHKIRIMATFDNQNIVQWVENLANQEWLARKLDKKLVPTIDIKKVPATPKVTFVSENSED